MYTHIEVMDSISGKTTRNIRLTNPLTLFRYTAFTLSDDTDSTINNVLAYASYVYDSLVWQMTDNGERARILFGGYIIYLYRA